MRNRKKLPLDVLAPYTCELPPARPSEPVPQIDFAAVFGDARPVEVEVGFGKGAFLVAAAKTHPETNWFGIENVRKLQLYVATRLTVRDLRNARVACADAGAVLRDRVAPASLRAVHVYFPDPWWKKRHKKRRVFTAEFAYNCARVVEAGGSLHIATDVEEYFGVMREVVAGVLQFRPLELAPPAADPGPDAVVTNFERKALAAGRPVWRAAYERDASAPGEPPPPESDEPEQSQ